MADAPISRPEVSATSMEMIDSVLQSFLIEKAVMLPKVKNVSRLAEKGVTSISLPNEQVGFVVQDKVNKVCLDAQDMTLGKDTLLLDKFKAIQWLTEDVAAAESRVFVDQAALERASKQMALQVDKDIIAEMELSANVSNFTGALAYSDILSARAEMRKNQIPVQELMLGVHPDREKEILSINEFISADYANSKPAESGLLGRLAGISVFISTEIDPDASLLFHESGLAYAESFGGGMRYQRDYDLACLAWRNGVDMRYGVKLLDSGNRVFKLVPTP